MAPRVWPAADREREIAEQPTWQLCPGASSYSYSGKHTDWQAHYGQLCPGASSYSSALARTPTALQLATGNSARGHLPTHTLASIPTLTSKHTVASTLLPAVPGGIFLLTLWQAYLLHSWGHCQLYPRASSSSYSGKQTYWQAHYCQLCLGASLPHTLANILLVIVLQCWQAYLLWQTCQGASSFYTGKIAGKFNYSC